ncbi:MAG: hypothetical protein CM15mP74_19330 [Halieaceae bacterium]|nr:MAG: hypothetical protein CM15mP74_19330 [Halieaceae bacterium]
MPWSTALDDSAAPFFRWFVDGQTNACFNLLDRHVLAGRGAQQSVVFEGDRWDPSKNEGRGGPVFEQRLSYRELLIEVALRARVLKHLGLSAGDRIALNLPNIVEQIFTYWLRRDSASSTPPFLVASRQKHFQTASTTRALKSSYSRRWLSKRRGRALQEHVCRPRIGQLRAQTSRIKGAV